MSRHGSQSSNSQMDDEMKRYNPFNDLYMDYIFISKNIRDLYNIQRDEITKKLADINTDLKLARENGDGFLKVQSLCNDIDVYNDTLIRLTEQFNIKMTRCDAEKRNSEALQTKRVQEGIKRKEDIARNSNRIQNDLNSNNNMQRRPSGNDSQSRKRLKFDPSGDEDLENS